MPAGTTFTKTVNGDYTAKTPGENIDRWHITGSLMIAASNVTVTNTEIDGAVDNEIGTTKYGPFSITDSTIGPASGCVIAPGLGESQYTAKRVLIRGHDDGFRMSANNINISDSFAQLCAQPSSHSDGIQAYCPSGPCQNVVFNHNTIDADKVPSTYALNLVDPNLSSVQATGNLLLGGAYVVDAHWHSGSTWTISNNRIVDKAWTYGPVTTESTCSHQSWSGNTLVTIDSSYNVTGTVGPQPCVQ